jgi:hypothetical protein
MVCEARILETGRRSGNNLGRRLCSLQSEALCAEARRKTGLTDFGDPPIEPALSILVNSLEREADLHTLGRFLMRIHLRGLLETRLQLTQAWNELSEALEVSPIERPVFITGMPRSGSSFLHELLAEDSENRAPRVWEVMFPVSDRNRTRSQTDPRVRKAEACLWWFRRLAPRADAVHPLRASTPHECAAIHSYTLLSEEFGIISRIPAYETFRAATDLGPVYAWQKRFLQYLQLSCPTRQWILKSPDHVHGLEHLFKVFPDAMVIETHRDPLEVLRSAIVMTEVLEGTFGHPGDHMQTRIREARSLAERMEFIVSFRKAHPELAGRFIDVKYHELVSDPMAVVRQIYHRLDKQLTERLAAKIQRMASRRSRYKGGRHGPKPADVGLDETLDQHLIEAYCSHFGIPSHQSSTGAAKTR